jgi:DNA-binding transcriptional regulator YiaG
MNGTDLKRLRNSIGLSVTEASRQVEVSARTWQRWESGSQRIPEGALKLFKILNGIKH